MTIIRDLSRGSVSLLEISGWLYYNKLHVCGQWWRVKLSEWVKIHLKNVSITGVSRDQSRPQHAATSSKILSLQLMLGLHTVNMYVSTQLSQVTQIEIENHMWQQNTGWLKTFLQKYFWKLLLLKINVQQYLCPFLCGEWVGPFHNWVISKFFKRLWCLFWIFFGVHCFWFMLM